MPLKCAFGGCTKDCIDFSNYCAEHHKLRVGKPVRKVAHKLVVKRSGVFAAKKTRTGTAPRKSGTRLKSKT